MTKKEKIVEEIMQFPEYFKLMNLEDSAEKIMFVEESVLRDKLRDIKTFERNKLRDLNNN